MVVAALISDSPVVSWQTEPSARQCACGKRGEKPGTVIFRARRLPIEPGVSALVYQISASGLNWRGLLVKRLGVGRRGRTMEIMKTLGVMTSQSE